MTGKTEYCKGRRTDRNVLQMPYFLLLYKENKNHEMEKWRFAGSEGALTNCGMVSEPMRTYKGQRR